MHTAIRGKTPPGQIWRWRRTWVPCSAREPKLIFRYKVDGRERRMELGPYPALSLSNARTEEQRHCRARAEGKDPLLPARGNTHRPALRLPLTRLLRKPQRSASLPARAARNEKHAAQCESTLETYVYPILVTCRSAVLPAVMSWTCWNSPCSP